VIAGVEVHDAGLGADVRATLVKRLTTLVKENVGVTVAVDVVEPHALERSLGKAKRIDDRR